MAANYGLVLTTPQFQPADYSKAYLGGVTAAQNQQQLGIMQQNANNETAKNQAYIPYLQQQAASQKMDSQIKQLQTVNQLTGSVMNLDPASRPQGYKMALQQASQFMDISSLPQEWGPEAEAVVKNAYSTSGQQLEQLKLAIAERQLIAAERQAAAGPTPQSTIAKIEADRRNKLISDEQADAAIQQTLQGKNGVTVFDPNTGQPTVQIGGTPGAAQAGVPEKIALENRKVQTKQLNDLKEQAKAAESNIQSLNLAESALNKFGSTAPGYGTAKKGVATLASAITGGGIGAETAASGDILQSMTVDAVLSRVQQTKGAVSDREMSTFASGALGLDKSTAGNQKLIDFERAAHQRTIEKNLFYQAYDKKYNSTAGADEAWNRYINEKPVLNSEDLSVNKGNIGNWKEYVKQPSEFANTPAQEPVQPTGYLDADGSVITQDRINAAAQKSGKTPEQIIQEYGLKPQQAQQPQVNQQLSTVVPKADPTLTSHLQPEKLAALGIDTPERQKHFLAQMAHETAGFTTLVEKGSGRRYEGRKDLGNVNPGDGERYKGRGYIQLTGRANYENYGNKLGIDLVNNPELAADPEIALQIAAAYWHDKNLNSLADKGNIKAITKRINGGYNGLADRVRYARKFDGVLNV